MRNISLSISALPPALIYSVVAALIVGFVGFVVWRRFRVVAGTDVAEKKAAETDDALQLQVLPSAEPLAIRSPLQDLSFDDVLSVTPMWNGLRVSAEEQITASITQEFGEGFVIGTNAVRFIQSTGEYVVEFSEKGKELLQLGKATLMKSKETGRTITDLIGLDGKIIEKSREVGKWKSVTGKLASVSSMIVGAAHVISGADVARKLEDVRRDVKFLVEARKNTQLAELEAIFHKSKQRLAQPLTENGRTEIRDFNCKLVRLRAEWRRDLECNLNNVTNANKVGRLKRFFSRQRSRDQKIADSISAFLGDIALIESSLVLQIALEQSVGDAETFFYEVLPGELRMLRKTQELLQAKASYLSGKLPDVHVEPALVMMNQLIERMSAFVIAEKLCQS